MQLALKVLWCNKAPSVGNIPAELLKGAEAVLLEAFKWRYEDF